MKTKSNTGGNFRQLLACVDKGKAIPHLGYLSFVRYNSKSYHRISTEKNYYINVLNFL